MPASSAARVARPGMIALAFVVVGAASASTVGFVRAWGYNAQGQCNVPSDLGLVRQVSAGAYFSAALRNDGTVRCWGFNQVGQSSPPVGMPPCEQVSCGYAHAVALEMGGTVVCWGYNNAGQTDVPSDLGPCIQVAAGDLHTLALGVGGTPVRGWGSDSDGQITIPPSLPLIAQISAGSYHSAALSVDGRVFCWGRSDSGQCAVPAEFLLPDSCSQIEAGANCTVALRPDGSVVAWGALASAPALTGCDSVSAGGFHGTAITSTGAVACWGDNSQGQSSAPSGHFVQASGGLLHTLAIQQENSLELRASDTCLNASDELVVRVHAQFVNDVAGAQLILSYDPAYLEPIEAAIPVGSMLPLQVYSQVGGGQILFAVGVDFGTAPVFGESDIAEFHFRAVRGAGGCSLENLVSFSTSGPHTTTLSDSFGHAITHTQVAMAPVTVDQEAPHFVQLPQDYSVLPEPGQEWGTVVIPDPVAVDTPACSAPVISVVTRFPDGTQVPGIASQFPLGFSTLEWTVTDTCGNAATVFSYVQVLTTEMTLSVKLGGFAPTPSFRQVRVSCAGWSHVYGVMLSSAEYTVLQVVIPGLHEGECFEVKDPYHSITSQGTVPVNFGSAAPIELAQGDSNNDDKVDILDFGIFVNDFGMADASGRSNFNGDDQANAADFGFIASEFLHVGDTCGSLTTRPPLARVSLKQLRLMGMPELATADVNGDGWVDTTDIALFLQGIQSGPAGDPADSRPVASGD